MSLILCPDWYSTSCSCAPVIFSDARHPFAAPLDFNFLRSHPSFSDCNYLISLPEAISFISCLGEGLQISTKPLVMCPSWRLSLDGAARQWQCPQWSHTVIQELVTCNAVYCCQPWEMEPSEVSLQAQELGVHAVCFKYPDIIICMCVYPFKFWIVKVP